MAVTWKLKPILDEFGITPYRLIQQSGVNATSLYRIVAHNPPNAFYGLTLDRILTGLYEITGQRFTVADVLEWTPDNEPAEEARMDG